MSVSIIENHQCVCGRQPRGFSFDGRGACSAECSAIMAYVSGGHPITIDEQAALWDAMKFAGEYLEEIGKFDLRDLTAVELLNFLQVLLRGFSQSLREQAK